MAAVAAAAWACAAGSYVGSNAIARATEGSAKLQVVEPRTPTKCTSCGSGQFKQHHSKTICTYCRNEQ